MCWQRDGHSRVGGNPGCLRALDSRLRGNDVSFLTRQSDTEQPADAVGHPRCYQPEEELSQP